MQSYRAVLCSFEATCNTSFYFGSEFFQSTITIWWHMRINQFSSFGWMGKSKLVCMGWTFSRLLAAWLCASVCITYILVLVGLSSAFVPISQSTHPTLLFPLHSPRSSCRPPSRTSCDLQISGPNAYITVVTQKSGVWNCRRWATKRKLRNPAT